MFDTNLPQPNDSFRWAQVAGQPALVCRPLEPFARHFVTTRPWQLGAAVSSSEAAWRQVADAAGAPLLRVHQVHGAAILVHRAGDSRDDAREVPADVVVSTDPSFAPTIQTADCVPILIADRRTGVVAAAHAGWRGLAAGVPRATVDLLVSEMGSQPEDLVAAAGPSIRACCYEVGGDVRERFRDAGWGAAATAPWFFAGPQPSDRNPSMRGTLTRENHWYFDSAAAARDQLESAGLPAQQIFVAGLCTASHDVFCSYRRDGAAAGRMAAVVTSARRRRP
jgi:YfiH family protein